MNTKTNLSNWSSQQLNKCGAALGGKLLPLLVCLAAATVTGQTYTILHNFGSAGDGSCPRAGVVQGPDGTLYGTTTGGGPSNNGTVFKMNPDGSGYAILHSFTGVDGSSPRGPLVLSGTTLYGVTYSYSGGGGTLFKLNADGSGFTVLKYYNGSDGAYPEAGLVLSGSTLYGVTLLNSIAGDVGYGTVFKVNTDGSGYTVLRYFAGSDGAEPLAGLLKDGEALYGTTSGGGDFTNGTVFKMNIDGSGFALLHSFAAPDAWYPMGSLALSGTTLYGTTDRGVTETNGRPWAGSVFKLNTDGSGFSLVWRFPDNKGARPRAGVLLDGQMLYGTTWVTTNGGIIGMGYGTVFKVNTDGTGFTVLKYFADTDGQRPESSLLRSGRTLFGTTPYGGLFANGVVFAMEAALPAIDKPPRSQTAELGSAVGFSVEAHSGSRLTYQWLFNETNLLGVATNSDLQLTDVQPANAGAYSVVVANSIGAVTSSPAFLSVIAPVPRRIVPALTLLGQTESVLNLDSRSTLDSSANWETFDMVSLTNALQQYFDLTVPPTPQRFYRAWQTNVLSPPSVRDVHMVPAITLTGAIGSSVRIDYINQFGPVDAWVTLATVTLTNTTQLYFDVSSIGQPQRLWRLMSVP